MLKYGFKMLKYGFKMLNFFFQILGARAKRAVTKD